MCFLTFFFVLRKLLMQSLGTVVQIKNLPVCLPKESLSHVFL